jgi:hypothetical protein
MDGRELFYVLLGCYTDTQLRMLICPHLDRGEGTLLSSPQISTPKPVNQQQPKETPFAPSGHKKRHTSSEDVGFQPGTRKKRKTPSLAEAVPQQQPA